MELAINLILLLLGIIILVWGANKFVDHSSVIAKHLGINDLVVGLTLIAAGTSAPEIFVAISAVINGNEDIAFGTAIGSNISNIALIFGVSCLYLNAASKTHLSNLLPFGISILMLGLIIVDGKISFNESVSLVGLFILFMYILLKTEGIPEEEKSEYIRPFINPGEDRRPTLTWPRQIPLDGEPSEVVEEVRLNAEFHKESDIPKLFINADPGSILIGDQREFARSWKNQKEVAVQGSHFIQEDSSEEIGTALRDFIQNL